MISDFFHDVSYYWRTGEYVILGTGAFLFLLGAAAVLGAAYLVVYLVFRRSFYSPEKTTKAKVVKVSYIPEHGGVHVSPVVTSGGVGTAITSDYEEEHDIVVLKSEDIGRFTIDSEELLESVEKGETVHVTYVEEYKYWFWNPNNREFNDYIPLRVKLKGEKSEVIL